MNLPDGRPLTLGEGILAEPDPADGRRIVLWLPGELAGGYRHWERVGTIGRAGVTIEHGIRAVSAASNPARVWDGGRAGRLIRRLARPKDERRWTMPGGLTAEQHGPRREGLALAWADDPAEQLDVGLLRRRWDGAEARPLGPGLYLISGIKPEAWPIGLPPGPAPEEMAPAEAILDLAERALMAARVADPSGPAAVSAAADLGIARIKSGDAAGGRAILEGALGEARRLGERKLEIDLLLGMGSASLDLGELGHARDALSIAFDLAKDSGDIQAEKAALERLGRVHRDSGDHAVALRLFERAAAIAAAAGDRKLEADLLWRAGIEHAELGSRGRAIARAGEAIDLMERLGRPDAGWYAQHLANYRSSTGPVAVLAVPPGGEAPAGIGDGPGLLRMAYTAASSMATFVGSGFKAIDADAYRERLAICSACEHHTGLRCRACGCFIAAKARLPLERCPTGRWPVRSVPN